MIIIITLRVLSGEKRYPTGPIHQACASRAARRHAPAPAPARSACRSMPVADALHLYLRRRGSARGDGVGSNVYTADSSLRRAAAHAGVVARTGGSITASARGGPRSLRGHRPQWGAKQRLRHLCLERALRRRPAPAPGPEPCPQRLSINPDLPMPLSCVCSPEAVRDGTVWGTDAYTSDSSLCRAACNAAAPFGRDGAGASA